MRERITCVDVGLLDFRPMGLIPLQIFCGKDEDLIPELCVLNIRRLC